MLSQYQTFIGSGLALTFLAIQWVMEYRRSIGKPIAQPIDEYSLYFVGWGVFLVGCIGVFVGAVPGTPVLFFALGLGLIAEAVMMFRWALRSGQANVEVWRMVGITLASGPFFCMAAWLL